MVVAVVMMCVYMYVWGGGDYYKHRKYILEVTFSLPFSLMLGSKKNSELFSILNDREDWILRVI